MIEFQDDPKARADRRRRRARIEARHFAAATDGQHLPSTRELILGSPFLSADIRADATAFAESILPRIKTDTDAGKRVFAAISALTAAPWLGPRTSIRDLAQH